MRRLCIVAGFVFASVAGVSAIAEEDERPWKDVAEFSFVNTGGNSESSNFALANKFEYNWTSSSFLFDVGALRAETTTITRTTSDDVTVDKTELSNVSAESYYVSGKYRRDINEVLYWYAGLGWDRNIFAGINSRYVYSAGAGYKFFDTDGHFLLGELGIDYTDEEQTTGFSDTFAGARGYLGYARPLSETSLFTSDLEVLQSLDDSDDLRARWINALSASLTSKLALKVSHSLFFDNEPALALAAPVVPATTGVLFPLDETDTILSASLVVNF